MLMESFHPVVGGGETHARLLGEALRARGLEPFILTQRRPSGVPRRETVDRLPVERVASGGSDRWGKYAMIVPVLFALLALRDRYDLIYVCGLRTLGLPALVVGRLLGKPVVLRAESRTELSGGYALESAPAPLRPFVAVALRLRNRVYASADAFVAISDDLVAEFLESGVPEARIAVIPNGIDTRLNRPAVGGDRTRLRERLGVPPDVPVVVYTGKLNRGKGLQTLIRAWERVTDGDGDGPHLLLVGGGANQFLSCEEELRALVASRSLGSAVTFTGYVTDVADHLRASDVFTLPSESEALPLSLLEALACGLPAVVTDVGGMPEVVTDGVHGLVVPPNDEDALERALRTLLRDPARRRTLGEAGRRLVLERFGIAAVAEAHEALFRDLSGRSDSAR